MGVSTAYHLALAGVQDVLLVEREPLLASGSTGRNAGGVRHQFSSESNVRLSIESISMFERFNDEIGYPIDFHQDGYLFLLSSEDSVAAFGRSVEMQRRLGVEVEWLTPDDARKLVPGLDVQGVLAATFCARDGICDPNGVTMGYAKAARSLGVRIESETEVTGIQIEGGRIQGVETNRGAISTPTVVDAGGPFAGRIGGMAGLEIPVLPYRRHMFITESFQQAGPHSTASILHLPSSYIMVIDLETTFYFHREGGGILFGMSDSEQPPGFDTTINWDFLEKVTPAARRRLPGLIDAGIAHALAGLYEVTPDANPIIGPVRDLDGFFIIAGFSGHGFQHCPAASRLLAEMITGRTSADKPHIDTRPFSFDRFSGGAIQPELNVV